MTSRQRFRETMRYGAPDRVPYFEEGLRDDVLDRWREQGLPPGAHPYELFETDRREQIPVDLEPRPRLDRWPSRRGELRELRERLDPDDPGRFPEDWADRVAAWRGRDHVLQLPCHRGFFLSMGVRDWSRFVEAVYLIKDDPGLVHETLDLFGGFGARLVERVLDEVTVDLASFSEPIGGSEGSLLSPRTYEEFVLHSYRPILGALRRGGVETVVFVTYANARALLPAVLEAGFDALWAMEVEGEAMDYRALRRQFGRRLRLIGGIDLDVLLTDKAAIRREIETKVPPLLAQGGYVPLADGRVRANVPFDYYCHYRRVLEEVTRR
ncbi:MAG: uroporphyrinogen decarboxylase family protein [Planctomycetota bacterium]